MCEPWSVADVDAGKPEKTARDDWERSAGWLVEVAL